MIKSSEIDINLLVQCIVDSEMGMSLIEADVYSFIDILAKDTTYKERQGMFGNDIKITIHLFHLRNSSEHDISADLTQNRMCAIQNIFNRWCALGYNKSKAKSPFASKKFIKYLEDIGFHKADYLILMVE